MSKIAAEILAGRHDDDINIISEALVERLKADTVNQHWVVRIDGESITYKDITWGTWRRFEKLSRIDNARFLFDANTCNAEQLVCFIACWKVQNGAKWEDALAEVDKLGHDAIETDIEIEVSDTPFDT